MSEWKCVKCGNTEFEKDQFQATGGNFSKICHDECILPVSAEAAGIHVNTNCRKIQEFLIKSKERMKQNHAEGPAMESFCSMAGPVSFPIAAAP